MALTHHRRRPQGVAASGTLRRDREGGYVLTLFGLMLVPLLLMVGLAVDVGYWYNRASDIQKAADAASLAGVVWLPDVATATSVAKDVAKRNGFDDAAANISVTVTQSTKAPRRLKVVITDSTVSSFFYKNLGGRNIGLTRASYAEYVTPVPMGSPRNFFGLGTLLVDNPVAGLPAEYLYQSVNAWCTSKANGDRHQSAFETSITSSSHAVSSATCNGTPGNSEYRSTGYELYIDAVAGRSSPIEIRLYDARFNVSGISTPEVTGQTCTPTYAATWTVASGTTAQRTVTGPAIFQTRTSTGNAWPADSSYSTLASGVQRTFTANLGRWKLQTGQSCVDNVSNLAEPGVDQHYNRAPNTETFTYQLFGADNTPLDDTDNPLMCTMTVPSNDTFDGYKYLGSYRWNTLVTSDTNATPCTIGTAATSGRYILRVKNFGARGTWADGSNQYGVVARYTGSAAEGLCDGRTDTMCPRVYGKDAISVKAASDASSASFYLAEIPAEHVGKKLRIELFDPGEGGKNIQIMKPTGANTWTATPFSYKVGTGAATSTSTLDVSGSLGAANNYNGKTVEITVDLTGYSPPTTNNWWQIKYEFNSGVEVTDRTTWSARILGDPVHLVEEN